MKTPAFRGCFMNAMENAWQGKTLHSFPGTGTQHPFYMDTGS
jgi:hypothetical protein